MKEWKAFLTNLKCQYCVSQWGDYDCSAHNKKGGDYYKYPSLSYSMDEHWLQGKL